MRIILASQSPFRKKALEILGLTYETIPSNFDEKSIRDTNPERLARKLSEAKARTIGEKKRDAIIISADLFAIFQGKIIEKPADENEAREMWRSFSGKDMDIIGAVSVYDAAKRKMTSSVGKYTVTWRIIQEDEMDDYISRYPVTTLSAGFEGDALLRFAAKSRGEYPFLTGLPMQRLITLLEKAGVRMPYSKSSR